VAVAVLQCAAQGRHVREPGPLGEEAPDLQVGVLARLDLAEQLHDEAVAEDDRAVALVGAGNVDLERGPLPAENSSETAEGRDGVADERGVALQAPPLGDDVEQLGTEGRHKRRVVQQGRLLVAARSPQHGDDRLGQVADETVRLLALGDPERHDVRVRVTLGVRDGHERHRDPLGEGNGRRDPNRRDLALLAREPAPGPHPRPKHPFEA
jgi:hypothetical protein